MPWTVIAKRLRASGLALPFAVSLAISLAVLCASPAPAQVGFPAPASPAAPVPAAPAPARNPVCLRLEAQLAAVDRGTVDPAKADQIKRYEDSSAKQQAELDRPLGHLAQYAAAEAGLQLEIAKQYPDITIGPGYTYEETHGFFTLGLSTIVPLFNRNQGPIAEAEARRKEAAAAFLERQAQVMARSERALAVYTASLKELSEAESLGKLQQTQMQITQQAIRSGADIRLSLDNVEIQSWVLARARLEALARAQRSLGDLEDAVQRPLDPGGMLVTIAPDSPAPLGPPKDPDR